MVQIVGCLDESDHPFGCLAALEADCQMRFPVVTANPFRSNIWGIALQWICAQIEFVHVPNSIAIEIAEGFGEALLHCIVNFTYEASQPVVEWHWLEAFATDKEERVRGVHSINRQMEGMEARGQVCQFVGVLDWFWWSEVGSD